MIVEAAMLKSDQAGKKFPSRREALKEAVRRNQEDHVNGNISRVLKSPYGGYEVRSLPAEFLIDLVGDGMPLSTFDLFASSDRRNDD